MTDNTAVRYVGTGDMPTKHLYTRAIYGELSELTVVSCQQLAGLSRP